MKTCITAPEPIEAELPDGACFVLGATNRGPDKIGFLMGGSLWSEARKADLVNPSPALLAFVQHAEKELLPKKKRSVGELAPEDLLDLVGRGFMSNADTPELKVLTEWASDRNIQLPEGE